MKRKASPPPVYAETLVSVTRALRNFTRTYGGDALTSAALDAFPLPGLRLPGDARDLAQPLDDDARTATASDEHVWTMDPDRFQLRNCRWPAFVDSVVASVRAPLGIVAAAQVNVTLRNLVLVRPGGQIPLNLQKERNGGKCRYHGAYGLNASVVTRGNVLCLVYDLVTSTVLDVPRIATDEELELALGASLTEFFRAIPKPKRFRISDDAWRTIHEFVVDKRLVYPVSAGTFEGLYSTDERVRDALAAFCARSSGQFVLYLASFHTSFKFDSRKATKINEGKVEVGVRSPWFRHGDATALPFPYTSVNHEQEVAPAAFIETNPIAVEEQHQSYFDYDEFEPYNYSSDHGYSKTRRHTGFALVVQPATLEDALWGNASIGDTINWLHHLVTTSPLDAASLAHRVLKKNTIYRSSDRAFTRFIDLAIALDDITLLSDVLRVVSSFEFDAESLASAVHHFGWASCVAIVGRLAQHTMATRNRVNLVCSLLQHAPSTNHYDELLDQVAAAMFWSPRYANEIAEHSYHTYFQGGPPNAEELDDLGRLYTLAYKCSLATLQKVMGPPNPGMFTVYSIVPAIVRVVRDLSSVDKAPLVPLLQTLHDKLNASLPALRNVPYAHCRLMPHCERCKSLKAFLTSTDRHVSFTIKNKTQRKHLETVIKREMPYYAKLTVVSTDPDTLQLTKASDSNEYSQLVDEKLALLASVLPNRI